MGIYRQGFQTFVNNQLPIGAPGDFASVNPRANPIGGPGQFVAPAEGTVVGVFGWCDPNTGIGSNYYKPNAFLAFLANVEQALITQFLGIASQQIVEGDIVKGFNQGDFYAIFASGASVGQKVYADPVTGALTAAAAGGSVNGSATLTTVTSSVMTVTTADVTGTGPAVNQAVTGGTLPEGTYIASSAGTGSGTTLWNLANVNGSAIPNQTAFTASFIGVQETNFSVASAVDAGFSVSASIAPAATGYAGVMTLTGNATGTIAVGDWVSGTGIPNNVQILALLSGTAGTTGATYAISWPGTVAAETITGVQGQIGVITSWGQAGGVGAAA